MHQIQKQLLYCIKDHSIQDMGHTEVARLLGVDHPQKIIHHLQQLEKKGFIRKNPDGTYMIFKDPVKPVEYFPLYGMAQCGPNGIEQEDDVKDSIPVPTKTFDVRKPNEYFFVQAVEDSMEPDIYDGDYVFIHKEFPNFNDFGNNIYLVIHNGGAKLKRVRDSKESGYYFLDSSNEKYDSQLVSGNDLSVIGRVHRTISKPT